MHVAINPKILVLISVGATVALFVVPLVAVFVFGVGGTPATAVG